MHTYEVLFLTVVLCIPYLLWHSCIVIYIVAVAILYYLLSAIRRRQTARLPVQGKAIVITGCDTGFGHDLAKHLDRAGFTVFAGCLQENGPGASDLRTSGSDRLHVISLDVTSDESVTKALQYVKKCHPKQGIWGIVCNAGIMVFGDVEFLTAQNYYRCLNVNFLGTVRVVRAFLPQIRQSKGRIVLMSSIRGLHPTPQASAYNVTKYALETYGDTLRLEMRKFGVNVTLVQPGKYGSATAIICPEKINQYLKEAEDMWAGTSDEVKQLYGKSYVTDPITSLRQSHVGCQDTSEVLLAFEEALLSKNPRTRHLIPGGDSYIDDDALLARLYSMLPTWLSDYVILWRTGTFTMPTKTHTE